MTDEKQIEVARSSEDAEGVVIVNEQGNFVDANQKAAEILRLDMEEVLTIGIVDVIANPTLKHGKMLECQLSENVRGAEVNILRGDGTVVQIQSDSEPLEIDGERHARCSFTVLDEVEPATPETQTDYDTPDPTVFDDIGNEELAQIVQNVRVDAPDGKMPLNAIMLDLAVGHNELEEYKKGALTLHKAIDERLEDEEKHNPNSKEHEVLREVKESAFGLYLRIQRGDEELHGNRDGEYSGYFN